MKTKDRETTLQRSQKNIISPQGAPNVSETQSVHPFISPRSSQDSSLIARIAILEKRVDEMEKKSSLALQV